MTAKLVFLICVVFGSQLVFAEDGAAPSGLSRFKVDLAYSFDQVNPSELNDFRAQYNWGSPPTTPSGGKFALLSGVTLEGGYRVTDYALVSLRLEFHQQTLAQTAVPGEGSIQDAFTYQAIMAIYDFPQEWGQWLFTFGGGLGKTLKFEYHQKEDNGADIVWHGDAYPLLARAGAAYNFTKHFAAFGNLGYEYVSSGLTAASSYNLTNQTIASGQSLQNSSTGSDVKADLSGVRLDLGLRVLF